MATLTPFEKANAAVMKQSPPPPVAAPIRTTGSQPLVPPAVVPPVMQNPAVPTKPLPFPQTQTSTTGNLLQNPYTPVGDEGNILQGYLDQFLGADNALMRDARTRGIEAAAAAGLQNSSIAAGASQRAALEVAAPLASQAFGMFGDRENRQWQTGERVGQQTWQTQQDRDQRAWTADQNRLDRDQQINMSQVQNWLNNESFMREYNANLALIPITNTTQLLNSIMQNAIKDPQVYTPDVISGLSEFFTTNFLDVMSRYFPSMYAQTGGS